MGEFDTVVDTFGLCSYEDPAAQVSDMIRVVKDEGRLLFLEHGRSSWPFMRAFMDRQRDRHLQVFGCEFNRDIWGILAPFEAAGVIHIQQFRRRHWGTTYFVVAQKVT